MRRASEEELPNPAPFPESGEGSRRRPRRGRDGANSTSHVDALLPRFGGGPGWGLSLARAETAICESTCDQPRYRGRDHARIKCEGAYPRATALPRARSRTRRPAQSSPGSRPARRPEPRSERADLAPRSAASAPGRARRRSSSWSSRGGRSRPAPSRGRSTSAAAGAAERARRRWRRADRTTEPLRTPASRSPRRRTPRQTRGGGGPGDAARGECGSQGGARASGYLHLRLRRPG